MLIRRPLCWISFAYALGIGCAYLLAPGRWLFPVAGAGLLFLFGVSRFRQGWRKPVITGFSFTAETCLGEGTLAPKRGMALLLAGLFLAGGFSCTLAMERSDPLEEYAVSPYQNVTYRTGEGKNPSVATGSAVSGGVVMPCQWGRVLKVKKGKGDVCRFTLQSGGRRLLLTTVGKGIQPETFIGRRIRFGGTVTIPAGRRNPGCFDYRLYLKTLGIRVIVKCDIGDISVMDGDGRNDLFGTVYSGLGQVKYGFLSRAEGAMSPRAYALFAGMLLGDKGDMDEDFYALFQQNGIAHVLSVSGLHVGVVYAFFFVLLGRRRSIPVSLTVLGFLILYAFFSEFSPPVVRAVIMIALHIFSKVLNRRYDLLTGVGLSALLILLLNPLQLLNVGFQLSFLAVVLLAFALPFSERFLGYRDRRTEQRISLHDAESRKATNRGDRIKIRLAQLFQPTVILQAGMGPTTAYTFNYVSFSAFLLNIPIVFIAGLIIPIGIMMIPLSILIGRGGEGALALGFDIAARIVEILLETIIRITAFADGLPWSHFPIVSPPLPFVFLYYGLLFFLLSETFRILLARRQLRIVLAGFVLITAVFALSFAVPACQRENSALVFVDVGQGDCLHIRTPEGRNYLIDGGGAADYNVGRNILRAYLLKNGIGRLDGVFVSHLHRDHYGGIRELSLEMPIGRLFLYDGNRIRSEKVLEDTGFSAAQLVPLSRGDRVKLGRDVWLDVLYPPKLPPADYQALMADDADENRSSLLMRLYYQGVTVLMTGDMGEPGEQEILRLGAPTVDVLKVGHHGSRTSTTEAFLKEVKPKLAVIQVGRNTFGHPTEAVLDRLKDAGVPVYRNDLDGAILMDIKSGTIRIKTLCDSP